MLCDYRPMTVESIVKTFAMTGVSNIENTSTANHWIEFPWNHLWEWLPVEHLNVMANDFEHFQPLSVLIFQTFFINILYMDFYR